MAKQRWWRKAPENEDLTRPFWTRWDYLKMDMRFVAAMHAAGYELTAASTVPGTKSPVLGYRRA
jgi:hypothetical protein